MSLLLGVVGNIYGAVQLRNVCGTAIYIVESLVLRCRKLATFIQQVKGVLSALAGPDVVRSGGLSGNRAGPAP
jgi:hypothetical protein